MAVLWCSDVTPSRAPHSEFTRGRKKERKRKRERGREDERGREKKEREGERDRDLTHNVRRSQNYATLQERQLMTQR